MYVCICRAVTEREVKSTIEAGAKTVQAVTQACCAGDDCGACHATIEDMIDARWGAAADGAVHLPLVGQGVTERGRAA
jgi:bacterioferritin-associated ferredoxin